MVVKHPTLLLIVLCTLAGCAEDVAFLEVSLELPANEGGEPVFVSTQVRDAAEFPFEVQWRSGSDPDALLLGPEPLSDHISVGAHVEDVDVAIRVRFCRSADCTAAADGAPPEAWFIVERPFYLGKRTHWSTTFESVPDAIPNEATRTDRCAIRGCVVGDDAPSYCLADGSHPCE